MKSIKLNSFYNRYNIQKILINHIKSIQGSMSRVLQVTIVKDRLVISWRRQFFFSVFLPGLFFFMATEIYIEREEMLHRAQS